MYDILNVYDLMYLSVILIYILHITKSKFSSKLKTNLIIK